LTGSGRHWDGAAKPVGVFDAKADALAVLEACGAPSPPSADRARRAGWYHPGRSGLIKLGPKVVLGHFGEFHPNTLDALDVSGPLCGFEVFIDAIPEPKRKATRTKPVLELSAFQMLRRDFAFVVDRTVPAATLGPRRSGRRQAADDRRQCLRPVRRPVARRRQEIGRHRVIIQPRDRTLTDEDLDRLAKSVIANVEKSSGGVLRGSRIPNEQERKAGGALAKRAPPFSCNQGPAKCSQCASISLTMPSAVRLDG
jgi:phenylalanyl-tRNA synthetase beta chain